MKSATIQLEALACPSCMQKSNLPLKPRGVEQDTVKILFNASKVKLDFDDEKVSIEEIEDSIKKLGYEVIKSKVK